MSIAENLAEVKDNIARAARKAGRKPEDKIGRAHV